jgi:hypothetical protein
MMDGTWKVGVPVDDWQNYFLMLRKRTYLDLDTGIVWRVIPEKGQHGEFIGAKWQRLDLRDHLKVCVHTNGQRCKCHDYCDQFPI